MIITQNSINRSKEGALGEVPQGLRTPPKKNSVSKSGCRMPDIAFLGALQAFLNKHTPIRGIYLTIKLAFSILCHLLSNYIQPME